jgi:V8-like Glu-specific endopeptidase
VAFAYLDDQTLADVQKAAIDVGLNTDANLAALAAGISPAFVGGNMVGGTPNAKLLVFTSRMNETKNLVSGQVPLSKWLNNAILLAGGAPQELVFRDALQKVATDSIPEAGAVSDVAATPRTDGGSLEIEIEEDDTLGVGFLLQGAIAARSVAKLRVHRHFDSVPSFVVAGEPDWGLGTGWMIGPRLLITNHHVVNARTPREAPASDADFKAQAEATEADFDYVQARSELTTVSSHECAASDRGLDYAVLRLDEGAAERAPLRLRMNPLTRLQGSALRERANVLQHPDGDPMRLGFRNNFVVTGSVDRLSYLTDTRGGSSGSPICDDAWCVAGLHRGWSTVDGEPVTVWGKEIRQENYGTPIGLILAHLSAHYPEMHAEILDAQPTPDA